MVYAAFVDLEKAYDSVSREKLWVALKYYGVSGKLLRAVQSLSEDGWVRVRVGGRESSRFQVKSGVRQGCPLSLWLFNIFIDRIVKEARKKFYGSIQATQMRVLRWIEGVSRLNRIRNVDLRGRLRQEGVLDLVNRWQQK